MADRPILRAWRSPGRGCRALWLCGASRVAKRAETILLRVHSDAKWRKLFGIVNAESVELSNCFWKLVGTDEPFTGHVPDLAQLGQDFVGDCGALNGPFAFSEIEWLLIPGKHGSRAMRMPPTTCGTQGLEVLLGRIEAVGEFELELSDEGLRIFGYQP